MRNFRKRASSKKCNYDFSEKGRKKKNENNTVSTLKYFDPCMFAYTYDDTLMFDV